MGGGGGGLQPPSPPLNPPLMVDGWEDSTIDFKEVCNFLANSVNLACNSGSLLRKIVESSSANFLTQRVLGEST